jgi:hypothetical protein
VKAKVDLSTYRAYKFSRVPIPRHFRSATDLFPTSKSGLMILIDKSINK